MNKNYPVDFKSSKNNHNGMNTYQTQNLSTGVISKKYFNQNIISDPQNTVEDKIIDLEFSVRPVIDRLRLQSNCWSRKLIGFDDLNIGDIVSDKRSERWVEILQNTYIYSYFKSLLYGITDRINSGLDNDSILIAGHAVFYHAIKRRSFTFETDSGFEVRYFININDSDFDYIMKEAKKFDFLLEGIFETRSTFELANSKYDRILRKLESKQIHNGPKFLKSNDIHRISQLLSKDCFPIANSYYRKDPTASLNEWNYCHSDRYSLLDGATLFGKAVFLYANANLAPTYDNYYEKNSIDDRSRLVRHEVSSVAGSSYPYPAVK